MMIRLDIIAGCCEGFQDFVIDCDFELVKTVNRGCSLEVLFPSAALTAPMPTCEARLLSRDVRDHEIGRNHIMTI